MGNGDNVSMPFIDAAKATISMLRVAARQGAMFTFGLWYAYRRARRRIAYLESMERLSIDSE